MGNSAQQTTPQLLKTPLWSLHHETGGKMVAFAGYDMPVQYEGMGVLKEHLHTRSAAGLFDVSHMGQALLTGSTDPAIALEKIVPGDMIGLEPWKIRYTVLLNDDGGILDDLMVTRWDDKTLFLIVNAACKDKDFAYIQKKIGTAVKLRYLGDRALLALQGPKAEEVMTRLLPLASAMKFMTATKVNYDGHELYLSRSGYTGEDGYEISVPADFAESFATTLLSHDEVKWIGLGARDSLRLEAGLCLYGHDLDEHTTPIEASLKWVIQKRRREEKGFCGAEKILGQMKNGTTRLRVGLQPEGKAPVREGTELFSPAGQKVGVVTSGGFGPSVDGPVAMGYVETAFAAVGTRLNAMLRGTARPCEVVLLPFIKPNYKRD
ncbi:MAG: glycine cleavage system aminomethyltransferase GcvT [Proteobacteria bacterium]|nr:glycine cleavage system aminomethyltransferase GcvT [Pseudomonadota bacterium]